MPPDQYQPTGLWPQEQILDPYEDRWHQRGVEARRRWERCYAPETLGVTVVRSALQSLRVWQRRKAWGRISSQVYCCGPRQATLFSHRLSLRMLRRLQAA